MIIHRHYYSKQVSFKIKKHQKKHSLMRTTKKVSLDLSFDKRSMIGISDPKLASFFSQTIRTNGDGKFYVPKCHVAQKIRNADNLKLWKMQGEYWAYLTMKNSMKHVPQNELYKGLLGYKTIDKSKKILKGLHGTERTGWRKGVRAGLNRYWQEVLETQ